MPGAYGHDMQGLSAEVRHDDGTAALADTFRRADRDTVWQLTDKVALGFPTFHPQGLVVTEDRIFLSSVEILEATTTYAEPRDDRDRTPGRGRGHLFVMDRRGTLLVDIPLGRGDAYHPGGLDWDGTSVWVPVAEYRPGSRTVIYRVDATTLEVHEQFEVADHVGAIVKDRQTGHLVTTSWGSRQFAEWNLQGRRLRTWANPGLFIDYQDCQYAATSMMLCAGVTHLPQMPSAGEPLAPSELKPSELRPYELGGISLVDIPRQRVLHEIPFQEWSSGGHVATRNPFSMRADGGHLTIQVAPDDGDDVHGTEILTYEATVAGA